MNKTNPLFVLGAPRSGTTFLSSLLERSQYGIPFETHFITKYYKRVAQYGNLNDKAVQARLVKDILTERAVMQWELNLDVDAFCESMPAETKYSDIVNGLCMLHASRLGYSSWGDKTPHYLNDINILVRGNTKTLSVLLRIYFNHPGRFQVVLSPC